MNQLEELRRKWRELTEGPAGWIIYLFLGVVLALALNKGLGLAFSTQYPVVTVKSTSMVPTLNVGDIVFVYGRGEYNPGDIVVFNGWRGTPIIHRIVAKAEKTSQEVKIEMWRGFDQISKEKFRQLARKSPSRNLYITKGDHNSFCDQCSGKDYLKKEGIYGKKIFRVPYLGWVKLGLVRLTKLLI